MRVFRPLQASCRGKCESPLGERVFVAGEDAQYAVPGYGCAAVSLSADCQIGFVAANDVLAGLFARSPREVIKTAYTP